MLYTALVPVKSLSAAKSRLSQYLSPEQREKLVLDMLHHVMQVLRDSHVFERIAVVSPDTQVLEHAQRWGAQPLMEEQHDHNRALNAAAQSILTTYAEALPAQALLTISADLPLLHSSDIAALVGQARQFQVVLAPARDGTGTNAVLMRPPLALPYLFGPGSLQRYVRAAMHRDLSSTLYKSCGLALDIDTIDDLRRLSEVPGKLWGETKPISLIS